jgi:Domain of unknown function (DUF4926)
MKYALFTEMALSRDLPEYGLRRGDVVRLLNDYLCPGGREGYSIEVCNAVGDTITVTEVEEAALEPLGSDEIFTIRRMTSAAAQEKHKLSCPCAHPHSNVLPRQLECHPLT